MSRRLFPLTAVYEFNSVVIVHSSSCLCFFVVIYARSDRPMRMRHLCFRFLSRSLLLKGAVATCAQRTKPKKLIDGRRVGEGPWPAGIVGRCLPGRAGALAGRQRARARGDCDRPLVSFRSRTRGRLAQSSQNVRL